MPRVWIDAMINLTLPSGGQANQSLMVGVSATQTRFDRMTLLRTIIGFDIAHVVHDSGEGSQVVSVGIGVASQEAFAAGSLSDPEVAGDFPTKGWVYRSRYRIWGFAADQPTIFTRRVDLDIRAKRVLSNGESFIIASNAAQEGVASSVEVTGIVRQLWMVG